MNESLGQGKVVMNKQYLFQFVWL